jgi:hypothetical protein
VFYPCPKSDEEDYAERYYLWLKRELDAYERYLDPIRCRASQLETAKDTGRQEAQLAIAKNLLGDLDTETIAKITGFTCEQVEALKTEQDK